MSQLRFQPRRGDMFVGNYVCLMGAREIMLCEFCGGCTPRNGVSANSIGFRNTCISWKMCRPKSARNVANAIFMPGC